MHHENHKKLKIANKNTAICSDNQNTYELLDSYRNSPVKKSRFTFLYLNALSIRKEGKFDELKCILQAIPNNVQIVLLTETWINNEDQAKQFELPNYTHYYNYRTDTTGGGVSAYVYNNLRHSLSESVYVGGNNYLWIKLENYAIELGVVYNPGYTHFKQFLEVYESQLEKRKRSIVFGDFNVDLLTKDTKAKKYTQLLKQTGYKIINKQNKKYSTIKSLLDHVNTNLKDDWFHVITINSSLSDHKQLYVELKKKKPPDVFSIRSHKLRKTP